MAEAGAGFLEQLKSCVVWSWTYLWTVWFFLVLFLVYILRVPLKLNDNWSSVSMFLNTLTPKFYVALTGTSSLISGLILIFEWWYFRKYGTSFIEQVSVSHLRPLLGGVDNNSSNNSNSSNGDSDSNRQSVSECKVWRNPLNLFRGAEYNRYTWVTGREPLTYYDMNLSAQDHQTFFTCDSDHLRPADAIMQKAWRERNPQARISAAHEALEINEIRSRVEVPLIASSTIWEIKLLPKCATAYILLAEEEATTIAEAEKLFKQALKAGDGCYRRSQQLQHHGSQYEAQHRRDTNVLVYIKRRLAMCARRLGRTREAVKMMRDLMKEFPLLSMFNIHENLLEALLELQAYADVQAVLAKYDGFHERQTPRGSAVSRCCRCAGCLGIWCRPGPGCAGRCRGARRRSPPGSPPAGPAASSAGTAGAGAAWDSRFLPSPHSTALPRPPRRAFLPGTACCGPLPSQLGAGASDDTGVPAKSPRRRGQRTPPCLHT
ncbi:suppressor of tumorigenicity 7 protein isoform X17 [Myotis myotis]|uniref:suppressor of tumorigenicity 7 protein isoform X17 n=1 Tax=Myotis myotis TaxID=51298 RepID=UPI00174CC3EF|nr:suppressor of tumorigenicity 7 protein isoform X17 [Myotis myotis]